MKNFFFHSLLITTRDGIIVPISFGVTGDTPQQGFAHALYWMKTRGFTPFDDWRLHAIVNDVDEPERAVPFRSFHGNMMGGV